jgi:hypothetical protein
VRVSANPNRRLLVGTAALALLVGGAVAACQSRDDGTAQQPVEVATGFVEAVGAFDADRAIAYLADDAELTNLIASVGAQGVQGTQAELRLLLSFLEATGYKQMVDSCHELDSSASVGTSLRCPFASHNFRSDEIGRGPFSGSSYSLTVRNGEIVQARMDFGIEEFSTQMWEPFATWVSKAYPEDAAAMYSDETHGGVRLTERSIRLWERHIREFAEEMGE